MASTLMEIYVTVLINGGDDNMDNKQDDRMKDDHDDSVVAASSSLSSLSPSSASASKTTQPRIERTTHLHRVFTTRSSLVKYLTLHGLTFVAPVNDDPESPQCFCVDEIPIGATSAAARALLPSEVQTRTIHDARLRIYLSRDGNLEHILEASEETLE